MPDVLHSIYGTGDINTEQNGLIIHDVFDELVKMDTEFYMAIIRCKICRNSIGLIYWFFA